MARLRINLLGPFHLSLDGEPVRFAYDKQRALLAYLAMAQGQPVAREKLGLLLWPDKPATAVQTNLRQAVAKLKQLLDKPGAGSRWLLATQDALQLDLQNNVFVDAAVFQALLADCSAHRHRHAHSCPACFQSYWQACQLYQGDFLEGLSFADSDTFESWVTFWRESFRLQALRAHQAVAEYRLQRGDVVQSFAAAMRLVALDPLHEEGNRLVMVSLANQGQVSQALAHYEHFRQVLQRELGVEPSAATQRICQSIRNGDWRTQDHSNLERDMQFATPYNVAPFVGREVETSEVNAWLNDLDRRLITITGLGGVGKTHLATAVAHEQAAVFRDGVVFLSLADVVAPESVLTIIAQALGCPTVPRPASLQQLVNTLREKDILLVLDHFEQLLGACNDLHQLLERCPNLVILVTSRQRLQLPGEWVFPLGGLGVPPLGMEAAVTAYSAVSLFVQVAQQVRRDFSLDEQTRVAVADICRMVEGLPLALVLLAAWVRVLPCSALAAQLRRSMDVIRSSPSRSEDSSMSLRVVLEQSWNSLHIEDRRALAALSVFCGGLDQQAAQEIAGADLDQLFHLVDHSLVQVSPEGRYYCHELVRQFAAEQLAEAGRAEQVAHHHFAYYLRQAEVKGTQVEAFTDLAAYLWFGREYANLEAALAWACTHREQVGDAALERLSNLSRLAGHRHGVHRRLS